jgi:hypothetical protein
VVRAPDAKPGATAPDPARCPLCGTPNGCAMEAARVADAEPGPCWCLSMDFTAVLAGPLPAAARDVACICAGCAARAAAAQAPSGAGA